MDGLSTTDSLTTLVAPAAEPAATPAAEPKVPEAPAREPVSRHFSALAKKERALVKEKERIKAERTAFQAERVALEAERAKYGAKPGSPREALERYGFSYKDATDYELNDGQPTPETMVRSVKEELDALKRQQEEEKRSAREAELNRVKQAHDRATAQFKTEIKTFVATNAETYELTALHDAHDLVYDTVEEYYLTTAKRDDDGNIVEPGRILSVQEAADLVEKYLEEQVEKALSTKKFKAKVQPQPSPGTPQSGSSSDPKAPAQQRTLTNELTSSTPTLISSPRVEEDRIKRALAALG